MIVAEDPIDSDRFVARIAAAEVITLDEKHIRLRELWRDGIVVTSFLRHYGCLFCHQAVAQVVDALPEIVANGARVVFVGNGSVNQAKRFFTDKKLPREGVSVVTDPERESFRAADMNRGYVRTFLNPGSIRAYAQAKESGHRITGLFGDLTQLGGLLVTRPPAHFVYFHKSTHAGDHPDMKRVLEIVRERESLRS